MPISRIFGKLLTGETVEAWTLSGANGLTLEAITYGGIVTRLVLPDGTDVVLGFNELAPYLEGHPHFGAITGRVAGRISGAQFTLDGETFRLTENESPNHLHGGPLGFDKQLWAATPFIRDDGSPSLRLHYLSPDGDQGYPGALGVTVTYTVTPDNTFLIETEATTTRPTPISLTNHSYFNLAGEGSGNILDHTLQIFSKEHVPMDDNLTVLDYLEPVDATTDMREPKLLRDAIPQFFHQHGALYSTDANGQELSHIARFMHAPTSRVMDCYTSAPYVQVYTASHLTTPYIGKSDRIYARFAGLCLECEGYANGINAPHMGSIVLRPGEIQRMMTAYKFSTTEEG